MGNSSRRASRVKLWSKKLGPWENLSSHWMPPISHWGSLTASRCPPWAAHIRAVLLLGAEYLFACVFPVGAFAFADFAVRPAAILCKGLGLGTQHQFLNPAGNPLSSVSPEAGVAVPGLPAKSLGMQKGSFCSCARHGWLLRRLSEGPCQLHKSVPSLAVLGSTRKSIAPILWGQNPSFVHIKIAGGSTHPFIPILRWPTRTSHASAPPSEAAIIKALTPSSSTVSPETTKNHDVETLWGYIGHPIVPQSKICWNILRYLMFDLQ